MLAAEGGKGTLPPNLSMADAFAASLTGATAETERRFVPHTAQDAEGAGERRQIDILLDMPDAGLVVVIENKIWQRQGGERKQRAYWEYACREARSRGRGAGAIAVLLSVRRERPACQAYAQVSYEDWLARLRELPEAAEACVVEQFISNMEQVMGTDRQTEELSEVRLKLWARYPAAMQRLTEWSPSKKRLLEEVREETLARCQPGEYLDGYSLATSRANWFGVDPPGGRKGGLYYCISVNTTVDHPHLLVGLAFDATTQIKRFEEAWRSWRGEHKTEFEEASKDLRNREWLLTLSADALPEAAQDLSEVSLLAETWPETVDHCVKALVRLMVEYLPPKVLREELGCDNW
jgi:hypothetical protein